jgi:metal-sulfur cluster biosynthetic enzyme
MIDKLKIEVVSTLETIFDPEIPIDIYAMGLIYDIAFEKIDDSKNLCIVLMTLTSPACPVAGNIVKEVEEKLVTIDGIDKVKVRLTFTPPWSVDKVSSDGMDMMKMQGAQFPDSITNHD